MSSEAAQCVRVNHVSSPCMHKSVHRTLQSCYNGAGNLLGLGKQVGLSLKLSL